MLPIIWGGIAHVNFFVEIMPRNVEIKAIARDRESQESLAAALANGPAELLTQEDAFFNVRDGRLKLRVFSDRRGELIQYHRDDVTQSKESRYVVSPTTDPASLRQALSNALGVTGVVRKKRTVYLHGATRIHFDEVDGLGSFIELEVVLADHEHAKHGAAIAGALMSRLQIAEQDLVAAAYADLLIQVGKVHERAFPSPDEARLVDRLRDNGRAAISRIALDGGAVVGHVVFSPVTIAQVPEMFRVLGLGPVAVLPEYQGRGIGSRIIREGLEQCRRAGFDAVVVLGNPKYYSRFGFTRASDYGIGNEYGVNEEFMIQPLPPGTLEGVHGLARYSLEFGQM